MTGSSPDDDPRLPDAHPPTADPVTAPHAAVRPAPTADAAPASVEPAATEPAPVEPAAVESEPFPGAADAAPAEPEVRVADVVDRSTVRHAPRYGRFILAGVLLGAVVAGLLALLTPPSQYSPGDLFWILFLLLGFVLGIAAAGLAVVLDRRSIRQRDARAAERRTPRTEGTPPPEA